MTEYPAYAIPGFPTVRWVEVTPEQAQEWLENHNIKNRSLRAAHVRRMARDAEDGNWLTTGDTIKFDCNGVLIDGQHRLSMIASQKKSVMCLVITGLDPKVKGVLDTNARRAAHDALAFAGVAKYGSFIAAAKIRLEMDRRTVTLTSGLRSEATNSQVVDWCLAHPHISDLAPVAKRIGEVLNCPPSPLLAAMSVLHELDADACSEFFTSIEEMSTNGSGDPRLALIRSMKTVRTFPSNHQGPAYMRAYYTAWNAWRDHDDLRLIKFYKVVPGPDAPGVGLPIPEPR